MFRGIKLNQDLDITIELWKNKNEIISEMPVEWCKEINYEFGKPTQLQLEIPKFIMRNNNKVLNNLYNKIKIRQQLIISINGEKERFIITDQSLKLEKKKGIKSFTCYSFEKTLENKRMNFLNTVTRTLVKDDLYVHDGLLDEVIKVIPDWKLGYIDEDAKMITEMANETKTINLFQNFTNNNVAESGLIWEKDVSTDVDSQYAVNIQIDYLNLKTYDSDGRLLKTESLANELKPLYTNIRKIKAYHYSGTNNRYGIKYIITLADGIEYEQIHTFTNVVNKRVSGEINLIYQTGNIVQGTRAKFISVDPTTDNVLNFMNVLQEQFDCVFKYDTINKVIDCYAKKNIGDDKPIELSYDTNVISVDIEPDSEVPNCLLVDSSNDISIMDMNPYGGNYLYNYKWYIDNEFFDDGLVNALAKYDEMLLVKQEEYRTLKRNGDTLYSTKTKYDSEIYSVETRIKYYNNLLTGFIAAGDSNPQQEQIKNQITELEARLNECIRERTSLQEQILQIEDDMIKISGEIQKENAVGSNGVKIFTDNQLEVLEEIAFTSIYEDSYYTTSFGLYNNALKVFDEMLKPQAEFTVECANLVKLIKNKLKNVIELGSFFMVDTSEIPELNEDKVRFIGYKLIPSDNKIGNVVFTNREFKKENLNFASNIGQKVTKSTSTISSWQQVWEDSMLSNNYVGKLIDGGLNLATTQINARTSRNLLDFSEYGSFWKDSNNPTDGNQVYIGNSLIAISTDGFKTSKTAMTAEGLIAQQVIGKLLLGQKLEITTDDGRFSIGLNEDGSRMGMHVNDQYLRDRIFLGLEKQSDGTQIAKLELKDKTGRSVVLDENGIISQSQFVVWDNLSANFPMKIPYRSDEGVYSNKKIIMSLYLDKYRAFERGLSSGGSTQTSSASSSSSSGSGGYCADSTGASSTTTTQNAHRTTFYTQTDATDAVDDPENGKSTLHQHRYFYNTEPHDHEMQHYHSFEVPYHAHNIDHTHTLDTTHNHQLEYSIHEQDSLCSNIKVYINGEMIASGINANIEIDITDKIRINQNNNIEIRTDTNGRITVNFFTKCFVGW